MTKGSTWTALRNPVFRRLWLATVVSGTCVAAHDNAATWSMNVLTGSPLLISLMSTVASLAFFLFTLPAGALADKIDRQKLVCAINLWLAATAIGLAVLGWLNLLNPYLILTCVFLIGVGFAFNAPAWTSIVPQIVSDAELPSAVILGGLQINLSGIVGPALAALLVPLAGANFVFALNATCFLLIVLALWQWKQPTAQVKLQSESFFESFGTVVHYVRCTPASQVVLARPWRRSRMPRWQNPTPRRRLPPTQTFNSITSSQTIVGNGGQNVILVTQLIHLSGGNLIISGGSSDTFIFNVTQGLQLDGGANIVLQGVPPSNVLFNFPGSGDQIQTSGNAQTAGIYLAPNRVIQINGGVHNSEFISGRSLSFQSNPSVTQPCPTQPCP